MPKPTKRSELITLALGVLGALIGLSVTCPSSAGTSSTVGISKTSPAGAELCRGLRLVRDGKPADPATVDLKALPPEPSRPGVVQVMPAPGLPDTRPRLVSRAKEHLGRRLVLDIAEIKLKSIEPATWPDAALGCPRPGEAHAQVITPGYRIVLGAAGRDFTYHTDLRDGLKPCPAFR